MSEALPGYVDTGFTITVVLTGTVRLRLLSAASGGISATLGSQTQPQWTFLDESYAFSCMTAEMEAGGSGERKLKLTGPFSASPVYLVEEAYGCTVPPGYVAWSPTYDYEETIGPFRLGVVYELIGSPASPQFARDYAMRYKWFADENTTCVSECAGYSSGTLYFQAAGGWGASPDTGMTPEEYSLPTLQWSATVEDTTTGGEPSPVTQIEFTGLSVNGTAVDTSDLDDGVLLGGGSGAVDADTRNGEGTGAASAGLPWVLEYDLDVLNMAGGSTGAQVDTVNIGTKNTPYTGTHTFRNVSWAASGLSADYEALSVNAAWAAAQ